MSYQVRIAAGWVECPKGTYDRTPASQRRAIQHRPVHLEMLERRTHLTSDVSFVPFHGWIYYVGPQPTVTTLSTCTAATS